MHFTASTKTQFIILTVVLFCFFPAQAEVIYVDQNAFGNDSGTSWEDAVTDLQNALQTAEPGDEIWVAMGTYFPTSGTSRLASFVLPDAVTVYGGFNGTETEREQRDWKNNPTILSGDIGVPGVQTDNSYHVVLMNSMAENYFIDGFIIQGGYANVGILTGEGGGISIQAAESAIVQNCLVRNNFALRGGGLHTRAVPTGVELQQLTFENNSSDLGAAVFLSNSSDIRSCLFVENTANEAGTVFVENTGNVKIYNCTFYLNLPGNSNAHVIQGEGQGAPWVIGNSIFWLNQLANNIADIYDQGNEAIVYNSILPNTNYQGNQNGNFIGDPLFVAPDDGDFRLQSQSVGVNAGDNSLVLEELDASGNSRIRYGRVDIGAVESSEAAGGTIFVNINANGANDGSSWSNALSSIAPAFDILEPNTQIWMAEGLYTLPTQSGGSSPYNIYDEVYIIGGFSGNETDDAQANPAAHPTIISGENASTSSPSANASSFVRMQVEQGRAYLRGLIFEDFYRDLESESPLIVVITPSGSENASLLFYIEDCIFRNNANAVDANALIWFSVGNPAAGNNGYFRIENCLFHDNVSFGRFIGAQVSNAITMDVVNCTFTRNSNPLPGSFAPMISALSPNNVTIANCVFWDNDVPGEFTSSSNVTSIYNSIYQITNFLGDSSQQSDNQSGDPLFTDPANNDFSLLPASPAIGAGSNGFVDLATDLAGNPRIQEGVVDMGCYESPFPAAPNCLGDFDDDNFVSTTDLVLFLANFGTDCGAAFCIGDVTGDGVVDTSDLLQFISLFGTEC